MKLPYLAFEDSCTLSDGAITLLHKMYSRVVSGLRIMSKDLDLVQSGRLPEGTVPSNLSGSNKTQDGQNIIIQQPTSCYMLIIGSLQRCSVRQHYCKLFLLNTSFNCRE